MNVKQAGNSLTLKRTFSKPSCDSPNLISFHLISSSYLIWSELNWTELKKPQPGNQHLVETTTKRSPAPFQKHSLDGATCQTFVIFGNAGWACWDIWQLLCGLRTCSICMVCRHWRGGAYHFTTVRRYLVNSIANLIFLHCSTKLLSVCVCAESLWSSGKAHLQMVQLLQPSRSRTRPTRQRQNRKRTSSHRYRTMMNDCWRTSTHRP